MKTQRLTRILVLFILMTGWITAQAQRQSEVPGDNFSLEGALELFKKSASPQEFEKMINDESSRVNNLDLNGDGYIDYIRVIDINEGNVHAFIMQAAISQDQDQDIAVITLEKRANGKAILQITGDPDIYGVETIIEPTREVYTNAGTSSARAVVNVWAWPSVQYIYGPYYAAWISPWGWNYRPHWWHSWRPVAYYDYHPYWRPYRNYYSVCHTQRVVYAHHIYKPYRTTSVIVHKRHYNRVAHYRSTRIDNTGRYRSNGNRSSERQVNTSVRYDTNGRIRSSSNQGLSSRSSTSTRNQQRGTEVNRSSSRIQDNYSSKRRSTSEVRSGSVSSQQRNSEPRIIETSKNRSGSSNRIESQTQRTPERLSRGKSTGSSNTKRFQNGLSANSGTKRSYSGSGSNNRSSSSLAVKRSQGRSSGSANVQRSTGSSGKQRSSSSSSVNRSSGSSSSSNARQNSGSSRVQQPSKSSSSVSRPSKSSSKSSGRSNTQRSSSSNNNSRGRN